MFLVAAVGLRVQGAAAAPTPDTQIPKLEPRNPNHGTKNPKSETRSPNLRSPNPNHGTENSKHET